MNAGHSADDLERERLALARERLEIERDRLQLEHDRGKLENEPEQLKLERGRKRAAWWAAFVPALAASLAILGSFAIATREISASRETAKKRADDELVLAAIQVILAAPTCDSAKARAHLAVQLLPDVLPDNLPDRVGDLRVDTFPKLFAFPTYGTSAIWSTKLQPPPITAEQLEKLRAILREAQEDRDLLCSQLGGG